MRRVNGIEGVVTATELQMDETGDRFVRVTIALDDTNAEHSCDVTLKAGARFAPGRRVVLAPKIKRD